MSASFLPQDASMPWAPASSSVGDGVYCPSQGRQKSDPLTDREERHRCAVCAREFRRRDALTRHVQIHDKYRPRPKSRKKACICCIRSKIKCLGERPSCSSCVKRNQSCEYDALPKPGLRARASTTESQPEAFRQYAACLPSETSTQSPSSKLTDIAISADHNEVNDRHIESRYPTPLQPTPGFDFAGMGKGTSFPTNLESFTWIFENNLDEVFPFMPQSPGHDLAATDLDYAFGAVDTQQPHNLEQEDLDTTAANEKLHDLPQPAPRDHCSPDDVWPMEWHADSAQRLTLPILGSPNDLISRPFYSVKNVTDATRTLMTNNIRLPLERVPWQTVALENFPPKEKLDHCIDLYFKHFDRTFMVVHRPTFDPGKFSVLTLAMASIGACYTNIEGAHGFSDSSSELVRRLLMFMAEYDPRFLRSDQYLAAKLLQSVQGFCGANQRLFELSESSRSSLVHNARSMGLFCYKAPLIPELLSLEDRWYHWINQEKYRRLGWAVYLIDSSVSYLHNSRPHLSVSDIDMEMPSSNDHWQAESAQSWAALHPWTENAPQTLKFRPLCRSLLDGTDNAIQKLNRSHHRYFILTLIRMIWSLKEINGSPMSSLGGVTEQLSSGRRHLQDILDRFLHIRVTLPVSMPLTRIELADAYREAQMIHMSHLLGAGDLVDWLHALIRSPTDGNLRLRMMQWASQDAMRVRNAAYHSSQVLAILRNYQANYPLEPFSAFHAGTVLWCMAQVLPRSNPQAGAPALRLDKIPTCEKELVAAREWISSGIPSIVGVFGVPDLTSEDGKDQVLEQTAGLLKRMTCWSISQNFLKVVTGLMSPGLVS